jgi:prolipoprotein diacylglyceryltransferase
MYPVLFHAGKVTLYSYGFMIVVGILEGLLSTTRASSISLPGISVVMFLYLKGEGTKEYACR